ncbi:hypothetical protein LY78DRAFT_260022 [Colletotrichum sublineola]|nr:hypothetical protein LY78DRAFT_260022 [Colletotrichum sublineola]
MVSSMNGIFLNVRSGTPPSHSFVSWIWYTSTTRFLRWTALCRAFHKQELQTFLRSLMLSPKFPCLQFSLLGPKSRLCRSSSCSPFPMKSGRPSKRLPTVASWNTNKQPHRTSVMSVFTTSSSLCLVSRCFRVPPALSLALARWHRPQVQLIKPQAFGSRSFA